MSECGCRYTAAGELVVCQDGLLSIHDGRYYISFVAHIVAAVRRLDAAALPAPPSDEEIEKYVLDRTFILPADPSKPMGAPSAYAIAKAISTGKWMRDLMLQRRPQPEPLAELEAKLEDGSYWKPEPSGAAPTDAEIEAEYRAFYFSLDPNWDGVVRSAAPSWKFYREAVRRWASQRLPAPAAVDLGDWETNYEQWLKGLGSTGPYPPTTAGRLALWLGEAELRTGWKACHQYIKARLHPTPPEPEPDPFLEAWLDVHEQEFEKIWNRNVGDIPYPLYSMREVARLVWKMAKES